MGERTFLLTLTKEQQNRRENNYPFFIGKWSTLHVLLIHINNKIILVLQQKDEKVIEFSIINTICIYCCYFYYRYLYVTDCRRHPNLNFTLYATYTMNIQSFESSSNPTMSSSEASMSLRRKNWFYCSFPQCQHACQGEWELGRHYR
jgi:hypothetical protein